jgi:hypothetical protein
MYQYSRTVTIKNGASMAPALRTAAEVTAYLNKVYSLQMRVGTEMFGDLKIHWICNIASLDSMMQLNSKLAQDKDYWDIMEKIKPYVLEGSVQDKAIVFLG